MTAMIQADNLVKIYHRGSEELRAIDGISLNIEKGDFISFIGPSGSGKTTLINIVGGLDNPTEGTLSIDGETVFEANKVLGEKELTMIRRKYFGYVFQGFYLIPSLTVYENTILPFSFYMKNKDEGKPKEILERLGLSDRMDHLPSQLSGGEMQRVAIARALINDPKILLADEPTGNLDHERSLEIGKLIRDLNENDRITVIMVTHDKELAQQANKTIELSDGKIIGGGI